MIEALPGRECGSCTVCCTFKPIDTPELVKPPGRTCEHCTVGGCAIYAERPGVCQGYLCAWKMVAWLPEEMRPDRSGVLIDVDSSGEVTLLAFRDGADFTRDPVPFVLASLIERGIPVQLSRPGPAGMLNAQARVNEGLKGPLAARHRDWYLNEIRAVLRTLENHAWEPFQPKNAGRDA